MAIKIVSVVGARPQFIKATAVSRAFQASMQIEEVLVHTGQHYDDNMSAQFFRELEIPSAKYNLEIGSGSHGDQTGRQLVALEKVLQQEEPSWVLVYGDTNSTLAGALSAAKLNIPIAHIEAGLRSFNRKMPEEINRILTDHCSDLLFAPTRQAVANLKREGLPDLAVVWTGDVMYDVALHYGKKAEAVSGIMRRLGLRNRGFVLATVHRASNTDDPACLRTILEGLTSVGRELPVVLPTHPRTRAAIAKTGLSLANDRVGTAGLRLIDPVGYLDMLTLEKNAAVVATDSGGVQKEAFFCRTPCVTLREETEWGELVEAGWNRLSPPQSPDSIRHSILSAIGSEGSPVTEYGEGNAAQQITQILTEQER